MSDEEKKKKRLELVDVKMMLTLAGAGCIVVLFFLFIGKFNSVLTIISKLFSAMTPIIIGFVIAFLLNPLVNHLRRAIKNDLTKMFKKAKEKTISSISDAMAVTLSVLLFLLIITALLWILIPQLYESVQNLYNNFDKYVSIACKDELTSPILHKVLNDSYIKELSYGSKGVGSQGDGMVQILAKDYESQQKIKKYLDKKLHMTAYSLTIEPTKEVRRAIIPVAGYGTRLFRLEASSFCVD